MPKLSAYRLTAAYLIVMTACQPVFAAVEAAPDVTPPQITHAPLIEFPPNTPRRIQATVTDDVGVAEVTLLYRSSGDVEYRRLKMSRTRGTDIYWADLPMDVGPKVEYIIQASDVSGNRVLGQLFEPYVTTVPTANAAADTLVATPPPPVAATRAVAPEPGQSQTRSSGGYGRWVWVGLGVAAVAALAGAAASHGGGGGGGGDTTGTAGNGGNGNNNGGNGGSGLGTITITAPVP